MTGTQAIDRGGCAPRHALSDIEIRAAAAFISSDAKACYVDGHPGQFRHAIWLPLGTRPTAARHTMAKPRTPAGAPRRSQNAAAGRQRDDFADKRYWR